MEYNTLRNGYKLYWTTASNHPFGASHHNSHGPAVRIDHSRNFGYPQYVGWKVSTLLKKYHSCGMIKREIGSKTNGITEKMDRFWGQIWCTTPYSVPIGPGDHPVSRPLSWWRTGIPHDLRNPQFTIWHPCAFAPLSKFPHQDRKYTCSWRKYLILATRVQGTTIYSKNLALQCPFELPIRR